jgi:hypothetical protein
MEARRTEDSRTKDRMAEQNNTNTQKQIVGRLGLLLLQKKKKSPPLSMRRDELDRRWIEEST